MQIDGDRDVPPGKVDQGTVLADCAAATDLHAGPATATIWTNDLTADYVHENSAYST